MGIVGVLNVFLHKVNERAHAIQKRNQNQANNGLLTAVDDISLEDRYYNFPDATVTNIVEFILSSDGVASGDATITNIVATLTVLIAMKQVLLHDLVLKQVKCLIFGLMCILVCHFIFVLLRHHQISISIC